MEWRAIDRPGYFGQSRDGLFSQWNNEFGEGNWKIAWQWGGEVIERSDALQVYQRAYTCFLQSDRKTLRWLIEFDDIFDTAPSNVDAALSYDVQETPNNHIHDVAIRRAVVLDLGLNFRARKGLLHVQPEKNGDLLGPHRVPFHLPRMIYRGKIKYKGRERDFDKNPPWWLQNNLQGIPDSIEMFYQQNKLLQVKE